MKHIFQEPFTNVDQFVIYQEDGGGLIRKRGYNGIDILVAVSNQRGDGLVKLFNNASGGNAQSTLNKPGCSLI